MISIDPRRVYVSDPLQTTHEVVEVRGAVLVGGWRRCTSSPRAAALPGPTGGRGCQSIHLLTSPPLPAPQTSRPGPNGERFCWWQCTVKGGREGRDVDAVQLARAVEDLGAGEILLNCIDNDGVGQVGCCCPGASWPDLHWLSVVTRVHHLTFPYITSPHLP